MELLLINQMIDPLRNMEAVTLVCFLEQIMLNGEDKIPERQSRYAKKIIQLQ
jgi:hypothetical protein